MFKFIWTFTEVKINGASQLFRRSCSVISQWFWFSREHAGNSKKVEIIFRMKSEKFFWNCILFHLYAFFGSISRDVTVFSHFHLLNIKKEILFFFGFCHAMFPVLIGLYKNNKTLFFRFKWLNFQMAALCYKWCPVFMEIRKTSLFDYTNMFEMFIMSEAYCITHESF